MQIIPIRNQLKKVNHDRFVFISITCIFLLFGLLMSTGKAFSETKMTTKTTTASDIADKVAIRELVDNFAILADKKDIQAQMLLFTEQAEVTSYNGGKAQPTLTGRQTIGKAFSDYLALFKTVYHLNGQQVTNIQGDKATSTLYGYVILINIENGDSVMHKRGVVYNDHYIKQNGHWLIDKRESHFVWAEKTKLDNSN